MGLHSAQQCRILLVFFGASLLLAWTEVAGLSVFSVKKRNQRSVAGSQQHYQQTVYDTSEKQDIRSSIPPETRTVEEYLARAVVGEKITEKWNQLKTLKTPGPASKPIIEEKLGNTPKEVTISQTNDMTLKDVFHYLQYYPLLYGDHDDAIIFEVPVDGDTVKLKLQKRADKPSKFIAHNLYKDPSGTPQETNLLEEKIPLHEFDNDASRTLHAILQKTLKTTIPSMFDAKLGTTGKFVEQLTKEETKQKAESQKDGEAVITVSDDNKKKAFREAVEFIGTSIFRKEKPTSTWLEAIHTDLQTERKQLEVQLNEEIKTDEKTKVKYELTANMLKTGKQAEERWDNLKNIDGVIVEKFDTSGSGKLTEVEIKNTGTKQITLKETFKLLQSFLQIHPEAKSRDWIKIKIPIGNTNGEFYLQRAPLGKEQILIGTSDADWPGSTERQTSKKVLYSAPYNTIVDNVLGKFNQPNKLGQALLEACKSDLNKQPNFDNMLEVQDSSGNRDELKTTNMKRAAVEFLAITMIAEAATPSDELKTHFLKDIVKVIDKQERFPTQSEMPSLENIKDSKNKNLKEGRSPVMDEITTRLLQEVYNNGVQIHNAFSSKEYPARGVVPKSGGKPKQGTKRGRQQVHETGDDPIPSYLLREQADSDHDGELITKRARMSCTGSKKRRKRGTCSLEELDDKILVDEKSIRVEDNQVQLEIVDRRDARKRSSLSIEVSPNELATPIKTKESASQSKRRGTSRKYAKVHKGLAVHGMIFSALGAIDYFSRGDDVRGGFAVSQSLHTLGGLTGVNEIAAKVGKQLLRYTALKVAKGLKMEKGLATFASKVDKFMEKGVGKLMGDIPGVGLVFDIYFIEQDVEALANLDLSNPTDVKMLPLRIVDLALDIGTTVLNLIGTFCPEAEVITEPLVIVLSIIRMAIDDFYIDIMEEMNKINWKSPWAGLEFIGALAKGIVEGVADFFTGGLRRQMETYQQQQDNDRKVVSDLRHPENFYTIEGTNGKGKTINLNGGTVSSFGGFINFKLFDNGWAILEIGDIRGTRQPLKIKVDKDLDSIVLGIGESRDFKWQEKTAKLWFVIPIKHYNVICGANLQSSSLHGTYYGNSHDNTFFAVQNQKTPAKPAESDSEECNYGKMDLKFVTGNYHYNLYGRGGNDIFYLGPQMSKVSGGEGSDVYIIQSDGGKAVIDNFAEDNKHDMVMVNVPFSDIQCKKSATNLDVTYSLSHHIRIKNWFLPQDPNYNRHLSFRSEDGVIFVPKAVTPTAIPNAVTQVQCSPVAIDKSSEEATQSISLLSSEFASVKQVVGSDHDDIIIGNDVNNIMEGGKGADHLTGGRNEDTYIIRATEGCDTIDNYADDFKKTTDVVVFDVPYANITMGTTGDNLFVYQQDNQDTSCFSIQNWFLGEQYQHMIFTSSDHVVFEILLNEDQEARKVPIILDYSKAQQGVRVDLSTSPERETGFSKVATVSDSQHNDHIVGNDQSNFLSCTGGRDYLKGGKGSDNYVVKRTCQEALIQNYDRKEKVDLLLLDEDFTNLRLGKRKEQLRINSLIKNLEVRILHWFRNSRFQHIWIRTRDGITANIEHKNGNLKLIPVEISKDPVECRKCTHRGCKRKVIKYDLSKDPWTKVTRFQLQSSHCSYIIKGNDLNNYIDPGSSNGYSGQVLQGGNGADTYVLKHGYGEFNKIRNFAGDKKNDTLQLGLDLHDIKFYFHLHNDVILASKSRPSSLSVQIVNYFKGQRYQHLRVITSDKVTFEITRQYPFMKILSVDLSITDSAQTITDAEDELLSSAQSIQGSLSQPNKLCGTGNTQEISGGSNKDTILGSDGKNIIRGRQGDDVLDGNGGNDIIFGGDGDDRISGGDGHDYIYGGNGQDVIDGGNGSDTLAFKGDGFEKKGVYVDLSFGFGKGADAEADTYKSIENVYGTIHNDTLIGSDSNNNLYGLNGDDIIIADGGGNDKLVGGGGSDRYNLDKAYGIKVIDNYAEDRREDTLSLTMLNATQVCLFLVGDDLYLQIQQNSMSSYLYHAGRDLTVVVKDWGSGAKYKHLKIAFRDTIWSSYALNRVRRKFPQMDTRVRALTKRSSFRITNFDRSSARFSWNPISAPVSDRSTKLFMMKMDLENPIDMSIIQLRDQQKEILVDSLDQEKHYLFALFLKICEANVATSTTLMTFGRQRVCSAANRENNRVTYDPEGSLSHGTTIKITCNDDYTLDNDEEKYEGICIDSLWQAPLPTCHAVRHCPQLTSPRDGHVTVKSTKQDSVAQYVCKKGFELDGASERICQANGEWQDENPTCNPMRCGRFPNVEHGKLEVCKHQSRTNIHGTLTDPREGFCAKIRCDSRYVESYRLLNSKQPHRWESYGNVPNGAQVCRDGKWVGYRRATCEPGAQLFEVEKSWLMEKGFLQIWRDEMWVTASRNEDNSHSLACSRLANDYDQPRIKVTLSENKDWLSNRVSVECPKIRFVNPITEYEGPLEVLVGNEWQSLCYSEYVTTNHNKETMSVCKAINWQMQVVGPSLVRHDMHSTKYRLRCPPNTEAIDKCTIEAYEQHCQMMLRCKQRCPNKYPVPNGETECTGQYEGDICRILCNSIFCTQRGPERVVCKSGSWVNSENGKPASSECLGPVNGACEW